MPVLQILMNEVIISTQMPDSWKEANISLIPKEGHDLSNFKNYRPISLLNNDYKLYANILADRLNFFKQNYIGEDQAGFLPNRQIKGNVKIVLDAIEYYDNNLKRRYVFYS